MTGTPFNDDLAGADVMLREQFEAAVGGLTPDIGRLVADGTTAGRGAVRRRRMLSGVAAAAVAVIAVGSITYASQTDLLGRGDDHATNDGQLVELEPATPRGLAAAVLAHTGSLGDPFAVGGETTRDHETTLTASVAYKFDDGIGMELDVYATDQVPKSLTSCGASSGPEVTKCSEFTLPDGTPAVYVEYGDPPSGDGPEAFAALVAAVRDGEVVAAFETMSGTTDLVLDQDALAEIAADPAIGLSTTSALNARGQDIHDFKNGGLLTGDAGNSSGSGTATASPPTEVSRPHGSRGSDGVGSGSSR